MLSNFYVYGNETSENGSKNGLSQYPHQTQGGAFKLKADTLKEYVYFFIQLNVPFKIISAHMRQANQWVGRKRENPEKNHLVHRQAELDLSHVALKEYVCLVV